MFDEKRLLAFRERFAKKQEEFIETLIELMHLETPTKDAKRLDAFASHYAEMLRPLCDHIETIPSPVGAAVRAVRGEGSPRVLVLLHMDTVWPVDAPNKPPILREDKVLRGPGVFDMKSSLVIALQALQVFGEMGLGTDRRFEILATPDEESGSGHSRALIEEAAKNSDLVLVLENPLVGGHIKYKRKGVARFRVEVEGKAAHAGVNPDAGVNAIHELAPHIETVAALADPEHGTTVNVTIVGGGTSSNTIPDNAWAQVDVRFELPEEIDRLEAAMSAMKPVNPKAHLKVSGGANRPPLRPVPGSEELADMAVAMAASLGMDIEKRSTGGGSDGSFTAALGVPTLDGIGMDGAGGHMPEEHILIEAIAPRCAMFAELCLNAQVKP